MAAKALLLLCMLAVAASTVAANSDVITLLLAYKEGDRVGTPGYSDVVTSFRTWAGEAYDFKSMKKVGFVDGITTTLKVRPTYKVFLANFVYDFGNEMITTSGDTVTDRKVNTIAITGGTGKYKGAYGEVTVTELVGKCKIPDAVAEYKAVLKIYY